MRKLLLIGCLAFTCCTAQAKKNDNEVWEKLSAVPAENFPYQTATNPVTMNLEYFIVHEGKRILVGWKDMKTHIVWWIKRFKNPFELIDKQKDQPKPDPEKKPKPKL